MDRLFLLLIVGFFLNTPRLAFAKDCEWGAYKPGLVLSVDGQTLTSLNEFHEEVARSGIFPPYYGKNLDAFYDVILNLEPSFSLFIFNHQVMQRRMPTDFKRLVTTFNEAKQLRPSSQLCLFLE